MGIERVHTVHKKLASGQKRIYYYVKKGGALFWKQDGRPLQPPYPRAFVDAYIAASESAPQHDGDMDRLISQYLASDHFKSRSAKTQTEYRRVLEGKSNRFNARREFGLASISVIENRRFRGAVFKWKQKIAKVSPRDADAHAVALSQVLRLAFKTGEVTVNHARGLEQLYDGPADHERLRPWEPGEIALFLQGNEHLQRRGDNREAVGPAEPFMEDVFLLALHFGLRLSDVATITWDADKGSHLKFITHKGRRAKRLAAIPILDEGRTFLDGLKRRQASARLGLQRTMIVGKRGRSMQAGSISSKMSARLKALDLDVTLHRLRNNFATRLVQAKFENTDIAEIMGWSVEDVEQMKRVYVDREEIVAAQVARLTKGKG